MTGVFRRFRPFPAVRGPQQIVRGSSAAPGEVQIIGVEAIGAVAGVGVSVGPEVVGAAATGHVGAVEKITQQPVIGVSAIASVAGQAPAVEKVIAGVSATASVGAQAPKSSFELAGISATGEVSGPGSYTLTEFLTGVQAVGHVGGAQSGRLIDIASVSATGEVNAQVPRLGPQIAGVSATGGISVVAHSRDEFLTGVAATGAVGTPSGAVGAAISGVGATGTAADAAGYEQSIVLPGVSAICATYGGDAIEDVFTGTGTSIQTANITYINRQLAVEAGRRVTGIWIYSNVAYSGRARLYRQNSTSQFTEISGTLVNFSHTGSSAFEFFTFPSPVDLDSDGATYRVGVYSGSTLRGCVGGGPASYRSGEATGSTTGWTVESVLATPSVGVSYQSAIVLNKEVAKPLSGVSATGATMPFPMTRVEVVGVEAAGATGQAGYIMAEPLTGVAATGQTGTIAKIIEIVLVGVGATAQIGDAIGGDLQEIPVTGVAATGQASAADKILGKPLTGVAAAATVGLSVPRVFTTIAGVNGIGVVSAAAGLATKGINGVGAIGLVAQDFDERTATGTQSDTGGSTYVDRTLQVRNGHTVGGIWLWSDAAYSGTLRIFRQVAVGTYAPLSGAAVSFSHTGGSQWIYFAFPQDVVVPDDGNTYYPSVYSASTLRGMRTGSTGDTYRLAGDVSTESSGWVADNEPASIGIQYRSKATPKVDPAISGVEGVGQASDSEGPVVLAFISGVAGSAQASALNGAPNPHLVGQQAVGSAGGFPDYRLSITLPGVQAIGYPTAASVSFVIRRRRALALAG